MELKEIEKLLEVAVKYGVKRLKVQDVEIEIGVGPSIIAPTIQQSITPEKAEIANEDMLFWSVEAAKDESTQESE